MIRQKKRKNIMDVNFEYYKIFYYVAKYHNFTKAAQALNNSQPNITRAMNWIDFAVVSTPAEVDSPNRTDHAHALWRSWLVALLLPPLAAWCMTASILWELRQEN